MSKFRGLIDAAKSRENPASPPCACGDFDQAARQGKAARQTQRSEPLSRSLPTFASRLIKASKLPCCRRGRSQEFSELVEDLLAKWLKARS